MTGHDNERVVMSAEFIIVVSALVLAAILWLCGCNGVDVKPSNDLANAVDTTIKNQQAMSEQIGEVRGSLTKIQETMTTIVTTITNVVQQQFETFQGSQRLAFDNFAGEMKTINETNTNTTAYGIGLVATVLVFVLAVIWLLARILRGLAGRLLK